MFIRGLGVGFEPYYGIFLFYVDHSQLFLCWIAGHNSHKNQRSRMEFRKRPSFLRFGFCSSYNGSLLRNVQRY
jgi:hypothetical protein